MLIAQLEVVKADTWKNLSPENRDLVWNNKLAKYPTNQGANTLILESPKDLEDGLYGYCYLKESGELVKRWFKIKNHFLVVD